VSGEGLESPEKSDTEGYHRTYDPCIPKWLNQAGVKTDFVRLETVGISGNSHMMMLEKNSDEVIRFIVSWMQKNARTS